ncbi:hypothetical protein [Streptomyces sp. NPDC007063]|uniref:hypothetical protein n=1 Tax=Streptomyces sp. NPDC007063 TaxID=3364772 RepID=UPI00367BD456
MIRTYRWKIAGIAAVGATLALTFPASASAGTTGAGSWDYVGSSSFYEVNGVYYSHPVKSHGGNFKACIYTSTSGKRAYALYEDDVNNYDDKVGSVRQQVAGGCETWDVSGAVDQ